MKSNMKLLTSALFLSLTWGTMSVAGEGSGSGGGVIVYQAKAIEAIMKDNTFLSKFADLKKAVYVKSITHLSWASGVTDYLVVTDKGCSLPVKTESQNLEGTEYKVTVGDLNCP